MRTKIFYMVIILCVFLSGCGNSFSDEINTEDYVGGIKTVDLLDKNAYLKNGDEMAAAVEKVLEASPNDFHMLKMTSRLFSSKAQFVITYEQKDRDYFYVGKLKDKKPHGYGVITYGDDKDSLEILYIGEFKDGKVDNGYGMQLEWDTVRAITYEGEVDHLKVYDDEFDAVPADGKRILPYEFSRISWEYGNEMTEEDYINRGLSNLVVARCSPRYIGEIKNGTHHGKGVAYYVDGTILYEGEFKNGSFEGKGKLYNENGELLKEGVFDNGELKKGNYYRENETYSY